MPPRNPSITHVSRVAIARLASFQLVLAGLRIDWSLAVHAREGEAPALLDHREVGEDVAPRHTERESLRVGKRRGPHTVARDAPGVVEAQPVRRLAAWRLHPAQRRAREHRR